MDDAETEAALLALGCSLEWQRSLYAGQGLFHAKRDNGGFYVIALKAKRHTGDLYDARARRYLHRIHGDKQTIVATKATLTAAKAACERHHATGKWE